MEALKEGIILSGYRSEGQPYKILADAFGLIATLEYLGYIR